MKKADFFLILFGCLFLFAWIYLDEFLKLESVYWLIGKIICFIITYGSIAFIWYCRKKNDKFNLIFMICYATIFSSFYSYREISKYERNACQDKFGRAFNTTRRSLGIPLIPDGWQIDSRGNHNVEWKAKDSIIGHYSKYIDIDSTCSLIFENDDYNLKSINGKSRYVSVSNHVLEERRSVSYSYYEGDSSRIISQRMADSIFAAEKIKKDY